MALNVIDHYPDINAEDVPKNATVKVVFNKGIIPQSITPYTFSVNDDSLGLTRYDSQEGTLGIEYSLDGIPTTAVFQPTINFTTGKPYIVNLYYSSAGVGDGTSNSIVAEDGEMLERAYTFRFTAGSGVLVDPFPAGIPSGELEVSGVTESGTAIFTGTEVETYQITATDPQHMEPNVLLTMSGYTMSGIAITFNGDITSSLAALSGLITVEETNVLF